MNPDNNKRDPCLPSLCTYVQPLINLYVFFASCRDGDSRQGGREDSTPQQATSRKKIGKSFTNDEQLELQVETLGNLKSKA